MNTTTIIILLLVWTVAGYIVALNTFTKMTKEHYNKTPIILLDIAHILLGPMCWWVLIKINYQDIVNRIMVKRHIKQSLKEVESLYTRMKQEGCDDISIEITMGSLLDFYELYKGKELMKRIFDKTITFDHLREENEKKKEGEETS